VDTEVKPRRPYSTKLRQEQALLTKQRVLDAARRVFIAGGYANVTMQDVAREAGVAYQTVYSQFGNKLQLALELCASEFPHVGATVTSLTELRDAVDPEAWLRSMGTFARRLYEPCAEVLRFMRESGDRELLGRYKEIERGRIERLAELGPQLERSGRLRPNLSGPAAVDLVWVMSGPEMYEQLILDRHWPPAQFEGWLGTTLADLILAG
jgi:TetR/AcrR family transcriptional regulator, regulator of autoinduction and epiphytic fitness